MYSRILSNITRHIQLSPEEQQLLTSALTMRKLRKRYFLVQAGDLCHHEYFVNAGCLRAFITDPRGDDHNLLFATEDWWISDMQSYLTGLPATMSIEALEDCEVLAIEKGDLNRLFEQIPALNTWFRILLQNAFVAQQQRIFASISYTAEERYAFFIQKYPQLEQRIPQHHVASYLGVSAETLSRIRRQWQSEHN